jgi:glutamate dehydrogenase
MENTMANVSNTNYKSKLLSKVTDSLDEMLAKFLEIMPQSYFETNDEATILQHLAAILFANMSGNQELIALANHDATEQTFIRFGSYPGLLRDILDKLPEGKSIQLARAYTADDNSLVIDIFDFDKPEEASKEIYQLRTQQLENLTATIKERTTPANATDFIKNVNAYYLQRFTIEEITSHCQLVADVRGSLDASTNIIPVVGSEELYYIAYAAGQIESTNLFNRLAHYFSMLGSDIREAFLENFDLNTPEQTALVVLKIRMHFPPDENPDKFLLSLVNDINRLPYLDQAVLDISFNYSAWSLICAEILVSLCHIAHQILATDKKSLLSRIAITDTALKYSQISINICAAFLKKFSNNDKAQSDGLLKIVDKAIVDEVENSEDIAVLNLLKIIVEATLKSNVCSSTRYALAFRLSPEIFLSEQRSHKAFGIFFVHGKSFDGFHVRFQDIARGGVRIVQPSGSEQYAIDVTRLFDEVYGLSYAQQLKNKDIPEGGSKGVILVKPQANKLRCGKSFVNSLLDLIIEAECLDYPRVDYFNNPELLFLGPDENVTNDLIEWIIARAHKRNYSLPNAFMSSKPNAGINHKVYGVTSEGVSVFLEEGLKNININPRVDEFTIKITGGPDGDVAGNLLKILHRDYGSKAKIVGIADGSGCAEDPEGLDHNELLRLVNGDLPITRFTASNLSSSGLVLSISQPGGAEARNTMHNRLIADVFIPSGGRPATINDSNYQSFLLPNDEPTSKLIVEGANLFLTQYAREKLSDKGVLIVKDSSANKCGVICSSYEIIASMMLSEDEFLEIKEDFVKEVIEKLKGFAMLEAKTLFREHYFQPELHLTHLSMALSSEIIRITDLIAGLIETHKISKEGFIQTMMLEFIPCSLKEKVGGKLMHKLPAAYIIRAMASILASHIIYHEGISYLASLQDGNLTEYLIQYLLQEEKTGALIQHIEQSELTDKNQIIELLKRGGTGTALRWGN